MGDKSTMYSIYVADYHIDISNIEPWYFCKSVSHIKKLTNTVGTGVDGRVWWNKSITVRNGATGGHTLRPVAPQCTIGAVARFLTY